MSKYGQLVCITGNKQNKNPPPKKKNKQKQKTTIKTKTKAKNISLEPVKRESYEIK